MGYYIPRMAMRVITYACDVDVIFVHFLPAYKKNEANSISVEEVIYRLVLFTFIIFIYCGICFCSDYSDTNSLRSEKTFGQSERIAMENKDTANSKLIVEETTATGNVSINASAPGRFEWNFRQVISNWF